MHSTTRFEREVIGEGFRPGFEIGVFVGWTQCDCEWSGAHVLSAEHHLVLAFNHDPTVSGDHPIH